MQKDDNNNKIKICKYTILKLSTIYLGIIVKMKK